MDPINFLMPLLIVGAFYFFILRPQSKARKDQDLFLENLAKGMNVVTSSGIYGQINKVEGDVVHLQVDTKTFMRFTKTAISKDLTEQVYKADEKAKSAS